MQDTVGEVRTNSLAMFTYGPHHTDGKVLDDQPEVIDNSSVRTNDVV